MPSSPEFGNTARNKRVIEIFEEIKAENFTETDCHIAVTRKIEINLQRKRNGIQPEKQNGFFIGFRKSGAKACEGIGNQNFFAESDDKPTDAVSGFFKGMRSVFQLSCDIRITHDRSRNQLGKQRNISRKIDGIFLRPYFASVNVYRVAENLKGIKADADRESDLQKRDGKSCCCVEI